MAGINKVILIGNLGADPEIRTLESGAKVARLRLATTESYTNRDGQRVENVEWHTVVFWRQHAEIAEKYLSKGKQIYVEGRLRNRQYKDKDGIDRFTTEIEGNLFQMLGRAPENSENQTKTNSNNYRDSDVNAEGISEKEIADDLPF